MRNSPLFRKLAELKHRFFPSNSYSHIIEISGACNAKCPYCPTNSQPKKPIKRHMSPELFSDLVKHQKQEGFLRDGDTVQLYNYKEPFVHPQINQIIEIARRQNLKVGISSNFISFPEISPENYSTIAFVVLSLCSLSKSDYKRIYGSDVDKTLRNFDIFLAQKDKFNPQISVMINWLRYKFNEVELPEAKKYFETRKCQLRPVFAYINEIGKMLPIIAGDDGHAFFPHIDEDFDIGSIRRKISYLRKLHPQFDCPQWHQIIIDESGSLIGCCEIDSDDDVIFHLGKILPMNRSEIIKKKESLSHCETCKKCIKAGLAQFTHLGYRTPELENI